MALGSSLDVLFGDNTIESKDSQTLRMSEIEPNKSQPRKDFDDSELRELAESIREHGLIQPIIVRPMPNGMTYQIVAGERRWRACRIAGINEVPVIIREMDDFEVSQIAIIENVQRSDLNPIEEALAYSQLINEYDLTQETVAKTIGKSRPYISNIMRLLNLPEEVQSKLRSGDISLGHAKALMGLNDKDRTLEVMKMVIDENMNVRQTEKLVSKINSEGEVKQLDSEERKSRNYLTEMALSITEHTGRKCKVTGKDGKGSISIEFYNLDDLTSIGESIIKLLSDNNEEE